MDNLGSVVLLAGPNGAGKSRWLDLIRRTVDAYPKIRETRQKLQDGIQECQKHSKQDHASKGSAQSETRFAGELKVLKNKLKKELEELSEISFDKADISEVFIKDFVPRQFELADPGQIGADAMHACASAVADSLDLTDLAKNALPYIQHLQNRRYEALHPDHVSRPADAEVVKNRYDALCHLIKALLDTELGRSSEDGRAQLFDKHLGTAKLSEGQKVLLQLAVAVHSARDNQPLIITMDEPENHLHPAILVSVLDKIRQALPNAQLWIATHSLPLVAHFYSEEPNSLYCVHNGSISHAGRKPESVVRSLLGDANAEQKMLNFVDLPHHLAAARFAAECLLPPTVAEPSAGDPQLTQIHDVLAKQKVEGRAIRVLDVGAGKGRLLAGLADHFAETGQHTDTCRYIDYVAFDVCDTNREACVGQIKSVYDDGQGRWFSDYDELAAVHIRQKFDIVIMCNVLHEIEPDHWLKLFGSDGQVTRMLSEAGALLLVEDLRIPVGEAPNTRGYFLLHKEHLERLFQADGAEQIKLNDARRDGRLIANLIPRCLVAKANDDSRKAAIESLQATAKDELRRLRTTPNPAFRDGQAYGLWSQQLVSCSLYLEALSSAGKPSAPAA
ncbi:MAG: AAA family ATPase [Rhodocyclaceae bacterium]|nr:AAA family ATPase [Rhodocyclaceae bacterium]